MKLIAINTITVGNSGTLILSFDGDNGDLKCAFSLPLDAKMLGQRLREVGEAIIAKASEPKLVLLNKEIITPKG